MSWFSSFVNILLNQNGREVERELTPTIYRNRKFDEFDDDDDLSDGDSFDDESDDELCFAQNVESRLEQAEELNLDFKPLVEKAKEIYQSSDSEGFALRSSPAAVYATVFRETRPPTPPEPDFPEFLAEGDRSRRASLSRFSALIPVQNEIEAKTKKFWGSFQKLAADKGSTLKRKLAPQTQNYHQFGYGPFLMAEDNYLERTRSHRRRKREFKKVVEGQSGFEDLRRHIKQGGDFSKELSSILHERSEAESQYAKCLSKLSLKLSKATKDSNGGTVNSTWARVAAEMENESEIHRIFAATLSENLVKPLRSLTDSQHRIRKSVELAVDKSAKNLAEWRTAEAKAKKHSFTSARDNEKLRDGGDIKSRISGSSLQISKAEKDTSKLETKRKKAEETVKKADVEYYNVCLRAERSRLEWESAILRGANCFEVMEDERLKGLRTLAELYAKSFNQLSPKLNQIGDRISDPLAAIDIAKDMETVHSLKTSSEPQHEQILPDFYPEQLTLAMNRERRKQAIVKLLQLIKGDLERERRGKAGVENLVMAFKQTPTFTSEDSQYNVNDKLQHMKSTLAYLEATRYKLESALCEIEGAPSPSHPLASHIQISRDRQGYQQSILKIPAWIHDSDVPSDPLWIDRGTADGTATHTDSDFDEFSSQESIKCEETKSVETAPCVPQRCKALYNYKAKLYDELNLSPGDLINIHDKQADGWWLGELNGTVGIFPATYVEEI